MPRCLDISFLQNDFNLMLNAIFIVHFHFKTLNHKQQNR